MTAAHATATRSLGTAVETNSGGDDVILCVDRNPTPRLGAAPQEGLGASSIVQFLDRHDGCIVEHSTDVGHLVAVRRSTPSGQSQENRPQPQLSPADALEGAADDECPCGVGKRSPAYPFNDPRRVAVPTTTSSDNRPGHLDTHVTSPPDDALARKWTVLGRAGASGGAGRV